MPKFVGTPCTTDPTAHLSSPLNMGNFNNCKKSLRIRCKSSFGFGTTATNAHLDNHLFLATFWLDVTTCEFFLKQMLIKSSNQSIAITHARHGWVYFLKRCNLDFKKLGRWRFIKYKLASLAYFKMTSFFYRKNPSNDHDDVGVFFFFSRSFCFELLLLRILCCW